VSLGAVRGIRRARGRRGAHQARAAVTHAAGPQRRCGVGAWRQTAALRAKLELRLREDKRLVVDQHRSKKNGGAQ